jgi:hypothetical protein
MRFRVANNMKDMDRRMIRDVVGEQGVSESHILQRNNANISEKI